MFLAENLADRVPAWAIWSIQRMGKRFQHIWLLNMQLGSHAGNAVAACQFAFLYICKDIALPLPKSVTAAPLKQNRNEKKNKVLQQKL